MFPRDHPEVRADLHERKHRPRVEEQWDCISKFHGLKMFEQKQCMVFLLLCMLKP